MSTSSWRYASSSVIGTSHKKAGKTCQDFSECVLLPTENGDMVLVAVASDGAGSAKCSELGSELACSLFVDEMRAFIECGNEIKQLTREFFEEWLIRFQHEVTVRADGLGFIPRDFACTFLAAVLSNDCAAFAQIGDGAIVTDNPEEPDTYTWVFWPQQGEYENTTYFATDINVNKALQFDLYVGRTSNEIAVFTDGLQRLALHYQTQSVHSPFFRSFFTALRTQEESFSLQYNNSLMTFLDSTTINERTDDDKTLILASRRSIPSHKNDL